MRKIHPKIAEIKALPKHYANDLDYLNAMTEHFSCETSRTLWALKVAGHTNISSFSPEEMSHFILGYRDVICELVATEAYNARHN